MTTRGVIFFFVLLFTATRSNQAAPAAPAAAPVDDAREYYSAKRRRQPKQAEPVLVKNSGNSLSALAQMATAHADSSEERSPAHWSDVDDSDSDLEENKVGRKRAAVRATEKKPRRSEKRHGGDSSRLVWTEDMVRTITFVPQPLISTYYHPLFNCPIAMTTQFLFCTLHG